MKQAVRIVGAMVVSFAAGAASMYHLASQGDIYIPQEQLESEVVGVLGRDLVALAHLRANDSAAAVKMLEDSVDATVLSLPQGQSATRLSRAAQGNIGLAKLYRSIYKAPSERSKPLEAVFRDVETPAVRYCDPVLRAVVAQSPLLARPQESGQ